MASGTDTPQYKAVQHNYETLAGSLSDPNAITRLCRKFKAKGWLGRSATPSADELVNLALDKIDADVKSYDEFIALLYDIEELEHVTKKITGIFHNLDHKVTCKKLIIAYYDAR